MNSHLNIFKSYTNINRNYQLENDLTRALAISLQEDTLFFHEVLKTVLKGTNHYNRLFEALENDFYITINILQKASQINNFDHIFAISLSERQIENFWEQTHNKNYDPICDLVIQVNDIVLVFDAKRDDVDCTAQLYNQIVNILKLNGKSKSFKKENFGDIVTPIDLSWPKLMAKVVKD